MRFCDLFISYKIGLKSIKNTIPFIKLPFYRKIFVVLFFASIIISGIFLCFIRTWISLIPMAIGIISMIIFFIVDSKKENLQVMLNEHYSLYSKQRIRMLKDVLKQYQIDINDFNSIDLLIEEAKYAQLQCDYINLLKKPFKILSAIIIPIIAFISQKIGDIVTLNELVEIAIQVMVVILLLFSLLFSLTPIIKDVLCRDYNKYEELIYDLRQLKLFYKNNNSINGSDNTRV